MKMNIDEAIELLQDYIKADREIREGDTESDYSKFCEEKCEAIESLIEYVYASRSAFKMSGAIPNKVKEVENINTTQFSEIDVKKILACLNNCTYVADGEYIAEEQRLKLIKYNYEILYKICDTLDISLEDTMININTLEIQEL